MAFQNTRPSIAREDFEYAQEAIRLGVVNYLLSKEYSKQKTMRNFRSWLKNWMIFVSIAKMRRNI